MSTLTARLGLIKQAGGDFISVAQLNTALDTIDQNIGLRICTSGTRPNTPYLGQTIYETDTKSTYFWNNTIWAAFVSIVHAEFSTSNTGIADGVLNGCGTVVLDTAKSTNTTFATAVASGIHLSAAGLYAVRWKVSVGATMTARTFAGISPGGVETVRASGMIGEDTITVTAPNIYISAAGDIQLQIYKNVGSTTTVTGQLIVSKLAG
jgi:hypothetical protein